MKLQVGGIYKFTKDTEKIVIEVLSIGSEYYDIKTRTHSLRPDMVGNYGQVHFSSKLFIEWKMEELPSNENFSIRGKKRLTKDELLVEQLIKHVQARVTKEHIMRAIDEALDTGNRNLFIVLTNQLNELEGVTA